MLTFHTKSISLMIDASAIRDSTISSDDPYSMNNDAENAQHHGDPREVPRGDRDHGNRDAGRDEHAKRGVKGGHRALDQTRARRLPIELREDQRAPLLEHLVLLGIGRQLLELCRQDRGRDR